MKTIDSADFYNAREALKNLKVDNKYTQAVSLLDDLEFVKDLIERSEKEINRLSYLAASCRKSLPEIYGTIQ